MKFIDYNFEPSLQEGLDAMRFENATPIQAGAIPVILDNKDLIAVAQTGTGKTAAYLLPILHKLASGHVHTTNTLIIVPTRELALQIDQTVQGLAYFTGASSLAIYGGGDGFSFDTEKKALTQGANIIIATPGRLMSHLNMGYVKFQDVQHFILDEADKMLDMGFVDDIIKISTYLPKVRQTLMFSATMPPAIRKLAQNLLKDPAEISIAISKPAAGVTQLAFSVNNEQKNGLIKHILKEKHHNSVLIFSGTKQHVKTLNRELQQAGFQSKAIHSDLEQEERENVLRSFKAKNTQILVATDILSRGIDIEDISLVINYDVPGDAEDYIHRIGRTARASTTGEAITFINREDQYKFHKIETLIERVIPKPELPQHLGVGPEYNPSVRSRPQGGRQGGGRPQGGKRPGGKPGGGKPHGRPYPKKNLEGKRGE